MAKHPDSLDSFDLFINGEVVPGKGAPLAALNPYTRENWARIATATREQVGEAVEAASAAFDQWRQTTGSERATLLRRLADLLNEEAEHLGLLETRDSGKPYRETCAQMHFVAQIYRFFADEAGRLNGETKPTDSGFLFDYTIREPIGVAALITPWNSPLVILANKAAPALAAGNCVVVKPSEHTSASTLYFASLVQKAGIPDGVFNVVTGGPDVGEALVCDRRVGRVSFTGSVKIGSIIAAQAASNVIPVTLELGGKSANIIFADANLDRAIPSAIAGIFASAGQMCDAGSRLLVQRDIHQTVVSALAERISHLRLGDPMEPDTDVGPLIHEAHRDGVLRHIETAVSRGLRPTTGGVRESEWLGGLFVAPTLFDDVDPDDEIAQNEIFGPVLTVIPFDTDEDAVQIANNSDYGLGAGIWTAKVGRAHSLARELNSGTVWINSYRTSMPQAPFGGRGLSGYGRERGKESLLEYTTFKNVVVDLRD